MGEYINRTMQMTGHRIRTDKGLAGQLLFFIIWPFGALLHSLQNIKSKNFLVIYSLFCIVFCWNMDVVTRSYDDLSGMASMFMEVDSSSATFFKTLHDYVTFSPDAPREIYVYFMMWLTRLFSDNPHTFFMLCAIPYLFFQVKCFRMFIEDERFMNGLMGVLIIFLFMWPRDIITVQNPRFTTALWLCVYVIMKSFHPSTKGYKHYFWLLLAPTIHSSFWFIAPLILLCIYVGKSVKNSGWLVTLVYISVPFSFLSSDIISNSAEYLSFLPFSEALQVWAFGYMTTEAEQVQASGSGFYWVPIFFDIAKNIAYLLVPLAIIRKQRHLLRDDNVRHLLSCYLFLFAISNFIRVMPVLGNRFYWFVQILSIYVLFKVYGMKSKLYFVILFGCSWGIFTRYFFGGAVSRSVPLIIFYTPLPYLIYKYWGITKMNVVETDFNVIDYLFNGRNY
mgnify:CR=1 FL=1